MCTIEFSDVMHITWITTAKRSGPSRQKTVSAVQVLRPEANPTDKDFVDSWQQAVGLIQQEAKLSLG